MDLIAEGFDAAIGGGIELAPGVVSRTLQSGALVRLVPNWYADLGPISIYYAPRTLVPAKTRVVVRFCNGRFQAATTC